MADTAVSPLEAACVANDREATEALLASNLPSTTHRWLAGLAALQHSPPDLAQLLLEDTEASLNHGGDIVDTILRREWCSVAAAVVFDELEAVCVLLARGADPNVRGRYRETPLMLAAERGNFPVVLTLLAAGADAIASDVGNHSALMYAAREGHTRVAELLLAAGAILWRDADVVNIIGDTGMAEAATSLNGDDQGLHFARFPYGGTALVLACEGGHVETADALLAAGGGVEGSNVWGQTALLSAVSAKSFRATEYLLRAKGADVNARAYRKTVWDFVKNNDDSCSTKALVHEYLLRDGDIVIAVRSAIPFLLKSLAERGVSLDSWPGGYSPIEDGFNSPLTAAIALGHTRGRSHIILTLLELGANPNLRFATIRSQSFNILNEATYLFKYSNWTPLMFAADHNDSVCAAALVKAGAEVNAVATHGVTALAIAVVQNDERCVSILLNGGAYVDGKWKIQKREMQWEGSLIDDYEDYDEYDSVHGSSTFTCLSWCVDELSSSEIATMLLDHGADHDAGGCELLRSAVVLDDEGRVADILIRKGVRADCSFHHCGTPLEASLEGWANGAHHSSASTARVLLRAGADPQLASVNVKGGPLPKALDVALGIDYEGVRESCVTLLAEHFVEPEWGFS